MRTPTLGFNPRGWVREKKVWRDGERLGRFEEKSSPSGGCERWGAGFLLQRHKSRKKAECRFNLSLSLNSKWPRPTNPTINNRVAHTNTTTNGGCGYHFHFLFCFLFYFSIYFNFICLFCFGYGWDSFFFFFSFFFSFLGLVCWLGLVAKGWWICVNSDECVYCWSVCVFNFEL